MPVGIDFEGEETGGKEDRECEEATDAAGSMGGKTVETSGTTPTVS